MTSSFLEKYVRQFKKRRTHSQTDESSRPILPSRIRFDSPLFWKHSATEIVPEDIPEVQFKSCFPVTLPESPSSSSPSCRTSVEQNVECIHNNPYAKRQPGTTAPLKVDCKKVSTPLGCAISKLCGYQAVMSKSKQDVFVMRHGERRDVMDSNWAKEAERPWDPPLTDWGKWQSYQVGKQLKNKRVTRIVCSPSLRCIQTAQQVIVALSEGVEDKEATNRRSKKRGRIFNFLHKYSNDSVANEENPPAQIKLSIDYGMCEVMDCQLDPHSTAWYKHLQELERMFPAAMIDRPANAVHHLPSWPENMESAVVRFVASIDRVSEQFLEDNILFISHTEAVHASVARCQKERATNILFAAYAHLKRNVYTDLEGTDERGVGVWHLATQTGKTGVFF